MLIEALLQHVRIQHTNTKKLLDLWVEILIGKIQRMWYAKIEKDGEIGGQRT